MKKKNGLVYGIGINDADYTVSWSVNGVRHKCPYYRKWTQMLRRCYDMKVKGPMRDAYLGVTVCTEWLTFSNFRRWMETQPWEGNDLDKDLLVENSRVYSPETCSFIPTRINCLFVGMDKSLISKIGAQPRILKNGNTSWVVTVKGVDTKSRWVGRFDTQNEANIAWRNAKYDVILSVIDWWKSDLSARESYQPDLESSLLKLAISIKDGTYGL